jgi:hypothetical protein
MAQVVKALIQIQYTKPKKSPTTPRAECDSDRTPPFPQLLFAH